MYTKTQLPSKHFKRGRNRCHHIRADVFEFSEVDRDGPSKPKDKIFDYGKVIEKLKQK